MSKPPMRLNVRSHVILRNLPHIVAAGDAGSLHRAAHHLGIAPSALSRRIADVEAELGAPLFHREPDGVRPTLAGGDLIRDSERLLRDLTQAIRRFEVTAGAQRQSLRIGFNSAAMMFPATAAALAAFRAAHPQADLHLEPLLSEAQYTALADGSIDVGIGYLLGEDPPFSARLIVQDKLALALPRNHPLCDKSVIQAVDIDGANFIGMQEERSGILARLVRSKLAVAGVAIHITMQAGSSEATLNLVAADLGLAFVNRSQGGRCPPNVVLREIADLDLPVPVALMWRAQSVTPLVDAFIQTMADHFAAAMPKSDTPMPNDCLPAPPDHAQDCSSSTKCGDC